MDPPLPPWKNGVVKTGPENVCIDLVECRIFKNFSTTAPQVTQIFGITRIQENFYYLREIPGLGPGLI